MRPRLQLLDAALVEKILAEAFQLLRDPGIRVGAPRVEQMLRSAGVEVSDGRARIQPGVARAALAQAPRQFWLYDRQGRRAVHYGGDDVHFDPGSSCLNVLDPDSLQSRAATSADLVDLVRVAEMLPQYAAQATMVVCSDVPQPVADLYRLLAVLWYSEKPVVTGAFSAAGLRPMLELLAAEAGSAAAMKQRPRAIFDVCPSPPLNWSEFAAENLLELARAAVPAQIVSMPLAGVAAPVTLAGAVVQHAAECISGIVIHQLAAPGAPIVWGGAPAIVDMRSGSTPMGAMETVMIDLACAQVGKHLGLPTHAYLAASDAARVDAQAGMESAASAVLGALAGINMISGAGMLDSLACHSAEKLVLDAEAIASAQRLLEGVALRTEPLATAMFAAAGPSGEFLKLPETRQLFRLEQHFPSNVVRRGAEDSGDAFDRARQRVAELHAAYWRPALDAAAETRMLAAVEPCARAAGLHGWPGLEVAAALHE